MTVPLLETVAIVACALFAGAALYITFVEHPARMSCGTELAATEFAPSYRRATVMQIALALIATAAGMARGALGGGAPWYAGAALIFAVIPYTLVVILPTNHRLLEPARDRASAETRFLLDRWARLHAVRGVLSLIAACVFAWAAVR